MKISVDSSLCQGHALCVGHVPNLIDYDDEGFAIVVEPLVPEGQEPAARKAAAGCPEGAISLTE